MGLMVDYYWGLLVSNETMVRWAVWCNFLDYGYRRYIHAFPYGHHRRQVVQCRKTLWVAAYFRSDRIVYSPDGRQPNCHVLGNVGQYDVLYADAGTFDSGSVHGFKKQRWRCGKGLPSRKSLGNGRIYCSPVGSKPVKN